MDFEEVKALVEEHVDLIAVDGRAMAEARERCAAFLTVVAVLTDFKREIEVDKIKINTLTEIAYSDAISFAEGKTITEKKIHMVNDSKYTEQRDCLAEMEALRDWVKKYISIFENAHVTYRQMAQE